MTDQAALAFAIENGIIDLDTIQQRIEMEKRKQYLQMHEQEIWQLKDGRYATHITQDGKRKLIRKTKYEDLENYLIELYKSQVERHTMHDVCKEWLDAKMKYGELEPQSYDRYKQNCERYLTKGTLAAEDMKNITELDLEDYIKTMIHEESLTAKAWSGIRTLLIGAFKYGYKHGYTKINIVAFFQLIEISKHSFRKREVIDEEEVFTDKEIEMITQKIEAKPEVQNLGILLAFQTGLRAGEIASLKYSDLDGKILHIQRTEVKFKVDGHNHFEVREFTKGKEGHRRVILNQEAVDTITRIWKLRPFGEYLFEENGERIHGQVFTNRLYRICKSLGITPRSMHKCRKTYASKLFNAGVPEKLIQKQLGHTNITTTQTHYHFDNLDIEESTEIIQQALG